MSLNITRRIEHPIERVFTFLTDPDLVIQWWGPDYVVARRGNVDFSKPGPWNLDMDLNDGQTVHLSGEVTEVDPPNTIKYTWGWVRPEGRGQDRRLAPLHEPLQTWLDAQRPSAEHPQRCRQIPW